MINSRLGFSDFKLKTQGITFSNLEFAAVKAGVFLNHEESDTEFDFRLCLLDADILSNMYSLGITLFDYDRSGFKEYDKRWVQLRGGIGYTFRNRHDYAMISAKIGNTTIKPGSFYFTGNKDLSEKSVSGFETGAFAELFLSPFCIDADYRLILGSETIQIFNIGAEAAYTYHFNEDTPFQIKLRCELERLELDNHSCNNIKLSIISDLLWLVY